MIGNLEDLPIHVINASEPERGFYEDLSNNSLFYLSNVNGIWYFQYALMSRPVPLEHNSPRIYAKKIDPGEFLKKIEREKKFVKSKLVRLTKQKR